jgi:hypothetical protein
VAHEVSHATHEVSHAAAHAAHAAQEGVAHTAHAIREVSEAGTSEHGPAPTPIAPLGSHLMRSVTKAIRADTLAPLRRQSCAALPLAQDTAEAMRPDQLREELLQQPALLCVVQPRRAADVSLSERTTARRASLHPGESTERESVLCLSPFPPYQSAWTPLTRLRENPALLEFFLNELKLVGGLSDGYNGLTMHTLRTLYPFEVRLDLT